MSAVIVDMYRGHEMEIDDGENKATVTAAVVASGVHHAVSVEDVQSFLAAANNHNNNKVGTSRSTRAVSDPPKRKRTSRTYQFNERDIRRYHQAKKEGRLRFPDLFMYHIQRSTDEVQREARIVRMHEEQEQEAVRIAAAAEAKIQYIDEDAEVEVMIGMDDADMEQVKRSMNQFGNAGIVTLKEHHQSPHHCDESMALKSEAAAGKVASGAQDGAQVRDIVAAAAEAASAAGITKTHEELIRNETKKSTKLGKAVLGVKLRKFGKRAVPVVIVAAAGLVTVVIITGSFGIGVAVAVPCAAITYGSVKLYEHCKNKRKLAKAGQHKKNGSAAESAPLAKVELAE